MSACLWPWPSAASAAPRVEAITVREAEALYSLRLRFPQYPLLGCIWRPRAATFQAAPGQLAQQPVPGQAQEVGQGNIFAYGNTPHA